MDRASRLRSAVVFAVLTAAIVVACATAARTQAVAPSSSAPAVAPPTAPPATRPPQAQPVPPPQAQPKTTPPEATGIPSSILTCASKSRPLEAGGAGLVSEPATGQRKAWQPAGGEVTFTVRSFSEFKNRARPQVCFQWRLVNSKAAQNYFPADINRVELSSDLRTMKITVTIPNLPPATEAQIRALGIVPIADVRILIQDLDASDPVEVLTVLGVTNPWWALGGAVAIGALAFVGLVFVVRRRLNRAGVPKVNPFLTVISTRAGYASLSQFQIVLWTFVVLISAVYVMALSGELIQITTGTLVLLGISGATTIGAKIQDNKANDDGKQNNGADKTPPADTAASQDTAGIVATGDDDQPSTSPMWADLITVKGKGGKPEIDVTRVQMLYFTLITAVFVGLRVHDLCDSGHPGRFSDPHGHQQRSLHGLESYAEVTAAAPPTSWRKRLEQAIAFASAGPIRSTV